MAKSPQLTRRGLFRGIGTASLITGCATATQKSSSHVSSASTFPLDTIGPNAEPVTFELNEQTVTVQTPPHRTLLDMLREQIKLTGTKKVCDRGACGACMVLIDGVPQNSCMLLAHDVSNRQVTTIEGLQQSSSLAPLQQAFIEQDALQCGFCTPGMLITCTAFLKQHSPGKVPEESTVRKAIAGNLCRCGTYLHVIKAVQITAQNLAKTSQKKVIQ